MIDFIVSILIVGGAFFALLGAIGVVRYPDVLLRMHAATKVGTAATGLILLGVGLHFWQGATTVRAVAIFLFLLLTAPIAAHMMGRAAMNIGVPLWKRPDDAPRVSDKTDNPQG
ncbi:MAG: monovalent cation/H(+) antiporter subunit G [Paracoccus sp. (in: a-proteobacteria)]|nr:monovalent cation/H(+) antiporter subunit G [Paracoccus sp. (in: a-proteobacteria)]